MVSMRLFLGPALALVATAAAAHDYVVVASSDPAIPRGQAVDAGARLPLASGRTVTLMYASGDLVTLKGASGGVVAPSRQANSTQAQRLAVLRMMLAPEATSGSGGKLTKARGGICPAPDSLSTLDDIAGVAEAGCADEARAAFEAWLAAHPAS